MNWRDLKRSSEGFKGLKGFLSDPHRLKPLEHLKPEELAGKCEVVDICRSGSISDRTEVDELVEKIQVIFTAERPKVVLSGTSEKQILLDFAATADDEKSADSPFMESCNHLILGARRPGRRKILRPLSVYEYRLAAEAGRREVFCENHRRELGGSCQHHEIIERRTVGDSATALESCLLWQKIRGG